MNFLSIRKKSNKSKPWLPELQSLNHTHITLNKTAVFPSALKGTDTF